MYFATKLTDNFRSFRPMTNDMARLQATYDMHSNERERRRLIG